MLFQNIISPISVAYLVSYDLNIEAIHQWNRRNHSFVMDSILACYSCNAASLQIQAKTDFL